MGEARLPAIHARELLDVLRKINQHPQRLSSISNDFAFFEMWHETNAQKEGTIRRETGFPKSRNQLIFSGPHFFVARPLYKTPRSACKKHHDYDIIDLESIDSDYLPRTNYKPDCTDADYSSRIPKVPWNTDLNACNFYRLACRKMMFAAGERTLIPSIVPTGASHIDGCVSLAFKDSHALIDCTTSLISVPSDFIIKTTGKSNFRNELASILPVLEGSPKTRCRTLALNCLTIHYTELWSECWDETFREQRWLIPDQTGLDRRPGPVGSAAALPTEGQLPRDFFARLSPEWQRDCALRTDFARRWALVELDVLVARELGLTLEELQTIYRLQFPVMRQFEADTWYDRNGRIVFTNNSQGLTGVGLPRAEWDAIKHMTAGTVTRTVLDTTLPTGPVERHITYQAPFTKRDREQDYAMVWAVLDAQVEATVSEVALSGTDLPTTRRIPIESENYLYEFLPQVFRIAGEPITLEHLFRHCLFLANLRDHPTLASEVIGTNGSTWVREFNQSIDPLDFRNAFDILVANDDVVVTETGLLRWNSAEFKTARDPWIHCDARFVDLIHQSAPESLPEPTPAVRTAVIAPLKALHKIA